MDSKKLPRKPKHERRDALKHFNYDAVSPVSSFNSSGCSSVYMDLYEGELVISPNQRIKRIITPRCWQKEVNEEVKSVEDDGLSEKCEDRDSVRVTYEVAKTIVVSSGCGGGTSGGFINGICPPMIKLPPGMRVQVVDNSSTWDLFKKLAPVLEGEEEPFNRTEQIILDRTNPTQPTRERRTRTGLCGCLRLPVNPFSYTQIQLDRCE